MPDTCYMCDEVATSREHAPPRCFFTKEDKKNYKLPLITVPSCDKHNSEKSLDDEYLRSIIVSHYDTNQKARTMWKSKVLRSLKRNNYSLFKKAMKDINPMQIGGIETGVFSFDVDRFNGCLESIANAIYFYEYKKRCEYKWFILNRSGATVAVNELEKENIIGYYAALDNIYKTIPFMKIQTADKDIFSYFRCKVTEEPNVCSYRFVFYGGFDVIAMPHFNLM